METEAEVASLDLNNIINEKVKRGEKSASNVTESQNSHVFVVAVVVVVSVLVLGGWCPFQSNSYLQIYTCHPGATPNTRRCEVTTRRPSASRVHGEEDEESDEEVKGSRTLKLNPALFDEDDSD